MISVFHMASLIDAFYDHRTTIYYEEVSLDISDPDSDDIPEITMCNIQPLSSRIGEMTDIVSFNDYLYFLENKFNCSNCNDSLSKSFLSQLMTTRGYFQYIGFDAAREVGHGIEDLLVDCSLLKADFTMKNVRPCEGFVKISLKQFTDIFNCYSISILKQPTKDVYTGYSLILYTGSAYSEHAGHLGNDPSLFTNGITMSLHQPSSLPFMNVQGHALGTGAFHTIRYYVERHKRLHEPYGGCVEPQQGNYTQSLDGNPLRYTALTCWTSCVEEDIIANCKCRDADMGGAIGTAKAVPFCGDAHASIDVLEKRMHCALKQRKSSDSPCYRSCPLSCWESVYKTFPSQVSWPRRDMAGQFYYEYIQGNPVQELFGSISNLTQGTCQVLNSSCSLYDDIAQLILDNFLGVQIYVSQIKSFMVGARPKLGPAELVSQIGGAINIWSGISVIVIIEIGELVINLILAARKKRYCVTDTTSNCVWIGKSFALICWYTHCNFISHGSVWTCLQFSQSSPYRVGE